MATDFITRTIARLSLTSFEDPNIQESSDPISSENLLVIRKFDKGKFPTYKTLSKVDKHYYAMKVFDETIEDADEYYQNELRFTCLNHPNVIRIAGYDKNKTISQRGLSMNVTYVLSEYAPYGDILDLIINHRNELDDKLARTYFRQLIEGLEYLHANGIAHLDIKPENLLLAEDFSLKITDFDLSHVAGDGKIVSRGTQFYRAPEFYNTKAANIPLEQPSAADIYSAGIILFILKSGGVYPHLEHQLTEDGVDFTKLLEKESRKFWVKHSEMQGKPKDFFDSDFKSLFNNMVTINPKKRFTIKKIKESKWYKGPVYTPQELQTKMKSILEW